MSLSVKLHRFKIIKCKSDTYASFEFRGESKYSSVLQQQGDYLLVNERFEFPLSSAVRRGEVLTLTLLSRGRWSTPRPAGVYRLGLQLLVDEGHLFVTDSLVDDRNKPVMAFVEMEVRYRPPAPARPDEVRFECETPAAPGRAPSSAPSRASSRAPSRAGSGCSSPRGSIPSPGQSEGEESALLQAERDIGALERSLLARGPRDTVIDVGPEGSDTRARRLKLAGKRFLKRGFSLGEKAGSGEEGARALVGVRGLVRRARARRAADDEEGLLDEAAGGTPAAEPSSDEGRAAAPPDAPKKRKVHCALESYGPTALKPADFQVCVTVIEARQLAGLNMDPVVCVQVGDTRRFTQVKESTNCPYYNEYFVFDFKIAPVMLFDKIITLSVLQSRHLLRADKLLGNFKLDVGTVFNQPDRQFYHKWALLTDPEDVAAGAKGFLKCDISVIGKGDTVKIPPKSEKDEDDIEANLLLPAGVPVERARARFLVRVHRADGLPKMSYSLLANVKKAITGEAHDLVDPYVEVSFAGTTGFTSVRKNCYSPEWNEQLVFTEMFPPLCQRIKIQLRDGFSVQPNVIGTHFLDLTAISSDGEKGFLPTFGPAYIHLYGSTRDYSYSNSKNTLNEGMGEGVGYRGRILVSIRTEILESAEHPISSEVERESILAVTESSFQKNEEFFLFGSIFEANMIDRRLADKPLYFEMSIGNCGNTLDGHSEPMKRSSELATADRDELTVDTGYWRSTTVPSKATSADKTYYHLPIWEHKQNMQIRSVWPDHRRRMYNSNLIANIVDKFEEGLADVQASLEAAGGAAGAGVQALKAALEAASAACAAYAQHAAGAPPLGNTPLDRERQKLCLLEIEQICTLTKNLKALITKHSIKDRLRTAYTYLGKLKHICEDPQHSMPDVFIWLVSNGKRLAYHRVSARDIIYSDYPDETGRICAKLQTVFLKWPGKKATSPSGWAIPAKISLYLWLGVVADKKHYVDGLPLGYELNPDLRNAGYPTINAPLTIYYAEKHVFQMRAYLYQARSLIGSDASGLSDPFATVIIGESSATTEVIDQTLSPTWDQMLVFDDVLLYGTIEQIKADPPTVVIEIFDQDSVGKSEFIGRTLAKPRIESLEELRRGSQCPPALEWHEIRRGENKAGELLAIFELLEVVNKDETSGLPALPGPREAAGKGPADPNTGPILPVPRGIRPTLSRYRIEVLFWGLRDVKRIHFLSVDRPQVDIECAGHSLQSSRINNAKRNPNFSNPVKFIDVDLPDQDLYQPPLTIRVQDLRSFGRAVLVGTHTINSIHKYIYAPASKREREIEERKKSSIQLQNVDLRTNTIVQEDPTNDNEKESRPLLVQQGRRGVSYGSGEAPTGATKKVREPKRRASRKRKPSTDSAVGENDGSKDWWTKYFASVEVMIEEEKEAKRERQGNLQSVVAEEARPRGEAGCRRPARVVRAQPRASAAQDAADMAAANAAFTKHDQIPRTSLTKIYPHELEAVPEYDEFKEWLHSFELLRGKKTGEQDGDADRVVGVFKGAIKVYKWPLQRGVDDHTVMGFDPSQGFFQGVPNNEPIHVLVRVYIVKATDLHPMDLNGKADPYVMLQLGSKKISDKDNYVSKQLNPVFGKCFEIEATFPQDSMLTIQVLDWDLLGADDLIGETKIDLENRFYSRHRATCGLPIKYEESGYNRWRDAMKPTQILAKLCKEGRLEAPAYAAGRVRVGRTVFDMPDEPAAAPDAALEQMALNVLRRWHEVPRVGTRLVTEHVETRPLYNPNKPGIEQGRLEMWVDMFPMDMPAPGPPLDISPRKPKSYEMRVIIWNTDDVVLEDDAFFTGEKMSDIYVKGWVKGPDDCQSTDIHYRSLTGEGNFNWRFSFPFDYLEAEERIVLSRKESVFSWDETESKIPARLELQVWDADHFSADDFLGAITLDLNRFPRGAKSAKLCTLEMLRNDGSVPMVNIFKQKRVKGWWPFYIKRDTEEMELTGKVEAEIHLLTREEADKVPAGLGRSEPDPLEKPNRPDASFMWFLNPLKSIRYIVWHNYKWTIIKGCIIFTVALAIFLLLYAVPGYTIKKLLGA